MVDTPARDDSETAITEEMKLYDRALTALAGMQSALMEGVHEDIDALYAHYNHHPDVVKHDRDLKRTLGNAIADMVTRMGEDRDALLSGTSFDEVLARRGGDPAWVEGEGLEDGSLEMGAARLRALLQTMAADDLSGRRAGWFADDANWAVAGADVQYIVATRLAEVKYAADEMLDAIASGAQSLDSELPVPARPSDVVVEQPVATNAASDATAASVEAYDAPEEPAGPVDAPASRPVSPPAGAGADDHSWYLGQMHEEDHDDGIPGPEGAVPSGDRMDGLRRIFMQLQLAKCAIGPQPHGEHIDDDAVRAVVAPVLKATVYAHIEWVCDGVQMLMRGYTLEQVTRGRQQGAEWDADNATYESAFQDARSILDDMYLPAITPAIKDPRLTARQLSAAEKYRRQGAEKMHGRLYKELNAAWNGLDNLPHDKKPLHERPPGEEDSVRPPRPAMRPVAGGRASTRPDAVIEEQAQPEKPPEMPAEAPAEASAEASAGAGTSAAREAIRRDVAARLRDELGKVKKSVEAGEFVDNFDDDEDAAFFRDATLGWLSLLEDRLAGLHDGQALAALVPSETGVPAALDAETDEALLQAEAARDALILIDLAAAMVYATKDGEAPPADGMEMLEEVRAGVLDNLRAELRGLTGGKDPASVLESAQPCAPASEAQAGTRAGPTGPTG